MQKNKLSVLVFLLALVVAVGPVSAATVNVDSSMTNAQIQTAITGANAGDTINFASGTYNGINLTINKALALVGNGATLVGNGVSILKLSSTTGVSINGFNININNPSADGITGSNVYSCDIENNNITNGDDGINIYMLYANLTINNNKITNMNDARDGISLVNHATTIDMDSFIPSTITNNAVDGLQYGIFLGGNFKGTVSGNNITNSPYGMTITGKNAATNGILSATISNNNITGIAMESPDVLYLNLDNNNISQLNSTGYTILTNAYFAKDDFGNIYVTNNNLVYQVSQDFKDATDYAQGNSGSGAYTKP